MQPGLAPGDYALHETGVTPDGDVGVSAFVTFAPAFKEFMPGYDNRLPTRSGARRRRAPPLCAPIAPGSARSRPTRPRAHPRPGRWAPSRESPARPHGHARELRDRATSSSAARQFAGTSSSGTAPSSRSVESRTATWRRAHLTSRGAPARVPRAPHSCPARRSPRAPRHRDPACALVDRARGRRHPRALGSRDRRLRRAACARHRRRRPRTSHQRQRAPPGATHSLAGGTRGMEAEVALHIGADVAGGATPADAPSAVAGPRLAIEHRPFDDVAIVAGNIPFTDRRSAQVTPAGNDCRGCATS